MADLATLSRHLGALAWAAFRAFAGTLLVFIAAGLVLSAASYLWLKENRLYGSIFAAVAFAEAMAAGIFMGNKRAILSALATGVGRAQLGSLFLALCFERLLQVSPEEAFGARGTRVAVALERLPLAQAEQRLAKVVEQLASEPIGGSRLTVWFWRLLRRRLLWLVQTCTLAHFRQQEAQEGGVDLVKVKVELGPQIDKLLISRLKRGLNLWTCCLLLALFSVVAGQIYIVLWKLHAR